MTGAPPTQPGDDTVSPILTVEQQERIAEVEEQLREAGDEDACYRICCDVRDTWLSEHIQHETFIAAVIPVMERYSNRFRRIKADTQARPDGRHAMVWRAVLSIEAGAKDSFVRYGKALRAAWGADVVNHYGWTASMAAGTLRLLAAAADMEPNWERAVLKWNQLLFHRHSASVDHLGEGAAAVRGSPYQPISGAVSPIERQDIRRFRDWVESTEQTYVVQVGRQIGRQPELIPTLLLAYTEALDPAEVAARHLGYDRFGLLVHGSMARPASRSARSEGVDGEDDEARDDKGSLPSTPASSCRSPPPDTPASCRRSPSPGTPASSFDSTADSDEPTSPSLENSTKIPETVSGEIVDTTGSTPADGLGSSVRPTDTPSADGAEIQRARMEYVKPYVEETPDSDAESDAGPGSESDARPGVGSDTEPGESDVESDAGPVVESDIESDVESDTGFSNGRDAGPGAGSDTEPDIESNIQSEAFSNDNDLNTTVERPLGQSQEQSTPPRRDFIPDTYGMEETEITSQSIHVTRAAQLAADQDRGAAATVDQTKTTRNRRVIPDSEDEDEASDSRVRISSGEPTDKESEPVSEIEVEGPIRARRGGRRSTANARAGRDRGRRRRKRRGPKPRAVQAGSDADAGAPSDPGQAADCPCFRRLLLNIDRSDGSSARSIAQDVFCARHAAEYKLNPIIAPHERRDPHATPTRKRRASDPTTGRPSVRRAMAPPDGAAAPRAAGGTGRDIDQEFVDGALADMEAEGQGEEGTWGRHAATCMAPFLRRLRSPGPSQAQFHTPEAAALAMETPTPGGPNSPMIVGQELSSEEANRDWIAHVFDSMPTFTRSTDTVAVQDPSLPMSSASCRNAPAHLVQRRFRTNDRTGGPINLLDMQSTVDPGTPSFLGGENCSLLRHMRRVALGGGSANRMSGSVSALAGWKDIESWLLIAQAGALTLPHQDPHGLDTWLRVLQGEVGVGWLADPTEQAMESFYEDPNALADCQDYRFVILRPGQVMFLPGGTVHFVFRRSAPAADTCMHGGHILRWSAVATFARVTELQLASPDSTNEDITVWAGVYMSAASRLIGSEEPGVRQRLMTADGVSEFNRVYRRVKRTYEKL